MAEGCGGGAGSEPVEVLLEQRTAALRESEFRFRDLIRRGSDGAIVLDRRGRVRFVNPAARSLLGRRSGALLGRRLAVPILAGQVLEFEIGGEGGGCALVEMRVIPTEWEGEPAHLALLRDVTEARRAQSARAQSVMARALSRAGAELNGSLDTETILGRLCRFATDVLACRSSQAYLFDPGAGCFRLAAESGRDARRVERVGEGGRAARSLLERLEAHELVGSPAPVRDPLLAALAREKGLTHLDAVALRRGPELIGFFTACHRDPGLRGNTTRRRILRGTARVAAAALENARRVEDLRRLGRERTDLLSLLSHELRSAVHVILGYDELLLEGDFGALSPEQADPVRRIGRSARHLADVIENTLALSRLESAALPLSVRETCLAELADELAGEIAALWANGDLRIVWDVPATLPRLQTDPTKLKLVLRNLVGNAVKFTRKGEVRVVAREREGGVEVAVSDTGPGIARERLDEIFEQFRQAGATAERGRAGVGLGLYIVRRMLEGLGGAVAVESEPGRGSVFRVWLPPRPGEDAARSESAGVDRDRGGPVA